MMNLNLIMTSTNTNAEQQRAKQGMVWHDLKKKNTVAKIRQVLKKSYLEGKKQAPECNLDEKFTCSMT